MKIRYIGPKAIKTDNVAESGAVWTQEDPVQDVADDKAAKLLKYPLVWAEDNGPSKSQIKRIEAQSAPEESPAEDRLVNEKNDTENDQNKWPVDPADPLEAARAEAKALGLTVHHKAKLETIQKAIAEAKAAQ